MSVQVLVATMNQKDYSLINKMNIQSDAIIANQCNKNEINEFSLNGHKYKFLSFAERGVGLNRNNALMRADADICILADDDIVFLDGYADRIENLFIENPHADVIIFNLYVEQIDQFIIKKKYNVSFLNFMRFGAPRIAFRRKSITKNGITFNLHFGGGADFCAGEDTLFLNDCLKKKLKIVAVPEYIASLSNYRESSWFEGYTDKFFIDRGALFTKISKRWAWLLCLQFSIRKRNLYKETRNWYEAFILMIRGINKIKEL